jgi:hypothetical protein
MGYVDVYTATQNSSGLPPVFAKALLGNGSYSGTAVKACAQAAWGAPQSLNTIAFTISACSWYSYTSSGASFPAPPPYPPNTAPGASADHILYEHGSTGSTDGAGCSQDNQSGSDGPGNFGWTSDSGNCSVNTSGSTYTGNSGASISSACQTALYNDWLNKTVVYLPVYNTISGTGGNANYTLLGFAAFVITGYHITGSFSQSDWLNSANNCTGNKFCIDGYFTQKMITSTGGLGGTPLGASIVVLSG